MFIPSIFKKKKKPLLKLMDFFAEKSKFFLISFLFDFK